MHFAVPKDVPPDSNHKTMAMDISFGSTGYALVLARAFDNVSCMPLHICIGKHCAVVHIEDIEG